MSKQEYILCAEPEGTERRQIALYGRSRAPCGTMTYREDAEAITGSSSVGYLAVMEVGATPCLIWFPKNGNPLDEAVLLHIDGTFDDAGYTVNPDGETNYLSVTIPTLFARHNLFTLDLH